MCLDKFTLEASGIYLCLNYVEENNKKVLKIYYLLLCLLYHTLQIWVGNNKMGSEKWYYVSRSMGVGSNSVHSGDIGSVKVVSTLAQ